MTPPNCQTILIKGNLLEALPAKALGKLQARQSDASDEGAFRVLDCFGGSVAKSRGLLIETDRRLVLYTSDGAVAEQDGTGASAIFVTDLAEGPVKDGLAKVSPLRSLIPIAHGRMSLRDVSVVDNEEKTHARARIRTLASDGASVILASVVGLRGYEKAFDGLTQGLKTLESAEAMDVGQVAEILAPDRPRYEPKPVVAIEDGDRAYDVANRIIAAHLPVVRINEPGVIEDYDTEFLHDYRVALRKIRSVISLFKGVYSEEETLALKTEFSDLMAVTGRLRDLDVYLLEKNLYFDLLPEALHPGLSLMFRKFTTERKAKHRALVRHLKSAAYAKRIGALEALFAGDGPAAGPEAGLDAEVYASRLIWSRYRKACKTAATIGVDTPDDDVHELRIRCKKLRYLMELFGGLYPEVVMGGLLKPLKKLQNNLGLFNDFSVQQISLQDYLDGLKPDAKGDYTEQAKSIGALIATLHDRQVEERGKVMANFARFDSPEIRDTFRTHFKGKAA